MNKLNYFSLLYILIFSVSALFVSFTKKSYAGDIEGKITILEGQENDDHFSNTNAHHNAIVFITGLDEEKSTTKTWKLYQKNKMFYPRVLPIKVGDNVNFVSKDTVYHNVWSLSKAKKFDLGQFKTPESKTVNFDKPGLVKVFCNIHPDMISSILVLKNSKFYRTKKDGKYVIKNIPTGSYQLRVWVEGQTPSSKDIKVAATGTQTFDFTVKRKLRSINHLNKEGKPYKDY